MNNINWTDFDGEKFQSFCNDLLSFEIGKNFIPFTAPGKDQGIDGLFIGEYNGKKGKWRFQAKFHHPNTGRVAGFNQLKSQIKKDLSSNVADETSVIFITNVELNPGQRKEIIKIAAETLKIADKDVDFDIWDGAKIHTLLAHHPIVKLWYTEQTKFLIQEYSVFFREELNSSTSTSYELSNHFYHRTDKLEALNKFIKSDTKKVAVVSGEAGIGKTRLCIEFFKKYIDSNNDWKALVIVSHEINLQVLQKALSGDKNYVVLLDDVDKFEERQIADLITLVKGLKDNNVKLLLTVRTHFLSQILSQIVIKDKNDRTDVIKLDQLSREETVQFLEGELNGYRIHEYLGYFVELTHGVPIIIMILLRLIKSGTALSDIKKDSFLKTYVKQHFEQFFAKTSEEYEIPKKDVEKIVKIISLIEPFRIDDEYLIQKVASTENINEEDVENVFQAMKLKNIISGHYQFDIKPDIYSDFILEGAIESNKWLEKKLPEYGNFINNIIKNIGYVYQGKRDSGILEKLLKEYINLIDICDSYQEVNRILDTVYAITYSMPLLTLNAVEKTLLIYTNNQHPLHKEFVQSLTYKNYSFDSTTNNLKKILRSLFQLDDYYLDAYVNSGRLYEILKDDGFITNIAGFGKNDRFEGFTCKKQYQILEASKSELERTDKGLKSFAIKALKNILKLEFTDTESHLFQKHTIQIYTLNIPANKFVKKLRRDIINLITNSFFNETSNELKDEIFKVILDIPREIIGAKKNNYNGKNEIKSILDFLLKVSEQNILELKQKQLIKDQFYWFKRWDIDSSFHPIMDEINENLSENDLPEQLLELFNPKYEGKVNNEIEHFQTTAKNLINDNNGVDLGDALVKVVSQSEYVSHFFYQFLDIISKDLDKATDLIYHLWTNNNRFVNNYCSSILRQFRFHKNYEDNFWDFEEKLKNESSIESINCLLNVYHSFSIHNISIQISNWDGINQKDIDLLQDLINISSQENYSNLATALPTIFYFDKALAIKKIKWFLKNCHERHLDSLFIAFDPIEEKNYREIKNLLLNDTIHLNLTYSLERFLNNIIKKEGFSPVLEYIENRLLFKRNYVLENKSLLGYEYLPSHGSNSITSELNEKQKIEIFSTILNWFVNFEFKSFEKLYAKKIIELFALNKYIDGSTKNFYSELIEKFGKDYNKLLNITLSLSEFKQKNDAYIDLIIQILEVGHEHLKDETLDEIISQCYISLTSLGVKSGASGQPFEVDLELKKLIENNLISAKIKNPKIKDFFQKVLKSIQRDIDRVGFDEGGEIW